MLNKRVEKFIVEKSPKSASQWLELLKPAIAIDSIINKNTISKFGGVPDVPPNFVYPSHKEVAYTLLAQVGMQEIGIEDEFNVLPRTGILYFFILNDGFTEYPLKEEDYKVIYCEEVNDLKEYEFSKNINKPTIFPEKKICFNPYYTLPSDESYFVTDENEELLESEERYDMVSGISELSNHSYNPGSHMLGHTEDLQGNVAFRWAFNGDIDQLEDYYETTLQYKDEGLSYVNLLQMSTSNHDLDFGQFSGVHYFGIKEKDLIDKNFDHVRLEYQID